MIVHGLKVSKDCRGPVGQSHDSIDEVRTRKMQTRGLDPFTSVFEKVYIVFENFLDFREIHHLLFYRKFERVIKDIINEELVLE